MEFVNLSGSPTTSYNDFIVSLSKSMFMSYFTRHLLTLNRTSVLFVSISFIVLMIISLVWLIFYYIQRFRYLQSKDQHSRHLCAVAKRVIMKIPTKSGKSDDKDGENDCCAICIEPYKATDCIRVLPCNHEFHKNCIDPWLLEHRTCPMCKLDVLKHYGFVVGDPYQKLPSNSNNNNNNNNSNSNNYASNLQNNSSSQIINNSDNRNDNGSNNNNSSNNDHILTSVVVSNDFIHQDNSNNSNQIMSSICNHDNNISHSNNNEIENNCSSTFSSRSNSSTSNHSNSPLNPHNTGSRQVTDV